MSCSGSHPGITINIKKWDIAYSELYFTNTLWPDFDAGELDKAIVCFNQRDRRYGGRDE